MPTEVRQGDDHEHDWVDIYLHNCLATGNHEPCFICEECGLGQCEDCGRFWKKFQKDLDNDAN